MPEGAPSPASARGWWPATAWRAAVWYCVLTLAMTWPLAAGITRDIPWDLGDSLLNCWILGWNADHVVRALGGDLGALRGILDGNIFHPSPLTLAYSELLAAQTLQILPVYALTKNLILCYNLLFLSSFVLSGLGAYLLSRHFTRDWRVAFVAGLVFAFVPYRWAQISHLQVISVQWMPFVLYGFARWADGGGWRQLAGATAALIAQNLSCGYFLVYFSLFVPPYAVWCLARHGRLLDVRRWVALAAAAAVTAACTVPFLVPYLRLRDSGGERREIAEVVGYSADTLSYLTSNAMMRLWGGIINAYPRPEGELFMGFTALGLAAAGCAAGLRRTWRAPRTAVAGSSSARHASHARMVGVARWIAVAAAVIYALAGTLILLGGSGRYRVGPARISITNFGRVTLVAIACATVAWALLPRERRGRVVASWRSPVAAFVAVTLVAWWLSLGPVPQAEGKPLGGPAAYAWLYAHVPGVDGLRVPARMGFIAALGVAMLAGFGLHSLARRWPRGAGSVCSLACVLVVAEGTVAPLPVNLSDPDRELAPPARVAPGNAPAALDQYLAHLPGEAVLIEFPFGDSSWELRHVYRSTQHWKRLVNGYSGWFPPAYLRLGTYLDEPTRDPRAASDALHGSGATHVVLHRDAYPAAGAARMHAWLTASGAREIAARDDAVVFELPR